MSVDAVPRNIESVLHRPEDQWFERKSGRVAAKDLAKPLVAFANAEGGYIAVGVNDGQVDGVVASKMNDLRQASLDFTEPPVRARYSELHKGDQTVLIVAVAPGEHIHRTNTGEVFLRVGDESRRLSYPQIQELEYDRGAGSYDGRPADIGESALDKRAVQEFASMIGTSSPKKALEARNLLARDGQVTVAALLLFGWTPQVEFPQAYVRVLAYSDTHRRSGSQQTLIHGADVRCEGTIPQQIRSAAKTIKDHMPLRQALGEGGKFQPVSLIPEEAWMEGLVNAVVHRSYSMMGDHIRVEIFPDRIEFSSPGRFPGIVDLGRPLEIARHARNPRIARVCADLGYAQELGEGVRRMYDQMAQHHLADPKFTQTSAGVTLVLSSRPALSGTLRDQLSPAERELFESLQPIHEGLRTGEIAGLVGASRPTTLRRLRKLRELGLVRWSGSNERDPGALWLPIE